MINKRNLAIACTLCATFLLLSFTSVRGFVLDVPKAAGVGSDPIKYSFNLGAGEGITFSFESRNATVVADFVEIAADASIVNQTQVTGMTWKYQKVHPFPWTLNITINATAAYTGTKIDFYAQYTYMRTSGSVLSIVVGTAAAAIGSICVYLLIAKRKVEEKA